MTPEQLAKSGTEEAHQTALFAWAAIEAQRHPELRHLFAIPNGGKRDKITAAKLKAQGVKAGVPDMFLPVPRGEYHGLFIELKKIGKKAEPDQLTWMTALKKQGYGAMVCEGWEQAAKMLMMYLEWSK
jgi:hypothetical protein